ncbi:pleckstrin homology domain-containing family A member kramer isoform X2 [Anticarsia gemmatalis]
MENKKVAPATQQPLTQQHLMAHHVHPDQIYAQQHPQLTHLSSSQSGQIQPNGVMHQLLQSQYHSNMNARSPLLENRHDLYGTGHNHDYARHYGANDNYNYPQSPPRHERTEVHTDHNVNHELHNIPKGYNAEVYQDYLKRNPPKDTNQIYQNHQPTYRPNVNPNQYGSKPYLPYSSRIGPQSNTELLRRQYSEIQQMKLQQQLHYQNQAQMHQQQKFAERQLLLQQIHGVQPPPNLQNSIYSDGSYRDLDRYSSKNDFKEYSSPDIQKDLDSFAKNNEYKEYEKHRQYQEAQWQNQLVEYRDQEQYRRPQEIDKSKSQSPPSDYNNQSQKNNIGVVSPMKSSESSTPSVKSPSSESRRSSGGNQALRSPIAQRIPSAPVTMSGILYKQGSDGLKVWRKRWFVLSEYCLFYYKSQDEEKLLGSVLLPSYKVSGCTAEDKVLRKFAFKLEHANMRTYILAAPDQEAMMKWVKALTMAALMQSPTDQPQKQSDRTAAKPEDGDEIPTYANAPPKPRRSNEGYNSPSPDMYDPNYDLLKKPASHYSQGTSHVRYQDHSNYPASPSQESTYTRSPQSPPSAQHQTQYQTKRPYDTQHLSLPLTNTVTDKLENNQPSTSSMYQSNPQSPYFDRNRSQQQAAQDMEQVYERQPQRNPFLQDTTPQGEAQLRSNETHGRNSRNNAQEERAQSVHNESGTESRSNAKSNVDPNAYNRDVYGELGSRPSRAGSAINERLLAERRTPDAYGRSTTMAAYNKGKIGDYEDVYGQYVTENEYGKTYAKSPNPSQDRDGVSISSHQQQQKQAGSYGQEKTFSGPSVLRRKKMQSSGIQPQMPRPHSADFLEYESKAEMLNKTAPARSAYDTYKEPQRPKSSLDINSYYDPSSDRYYSEESYAEKMRQSAQYLQQGLSATPRNMEIPLAKYASGLAKKQLSTAYSQMTNNNYEAEFSTNRDNASYASKYGDMEALNSNWTLKEKVESQKENYLNRSGSVLSDGSNVSGFVKEASKYDVAADGFMRSASARLPSTAPEKEGEKKVQQREESMKRLLEWKQRMLQSPLTRKSTPATISLARSLNQSRQSLRSDQYKPKTYTNASYNSYSSDDEEETPGTDLQKPRDMQAGRSHKVNLTSPIVMRPITPHASSITQLSTEDTYEEKIITNNLENTYQNVLCTISLPKLELEDKSNDYTDATEQIEDSTEHREDGYETNDSEAESETQMEYTDNDLDEVLLQSDEETTNNLQENNAAAVETENEDVNIQESDKNQEDPPVSPPVPGENHYLPMSPRKVSVIEPPHKAIFESLSVFDQTMPLGYEDNPYVEMNIGNEEEDTQTYEIVCVNNGKVEPVYMELNNVEPCENKIKEGTVSSKLLDTASNFADSNNHTLKRASKTDKAAKEKIVSSDIDDETNKEVTLDTPFSRFSISDTFRPASYYLSGSKNALDQQDSSDSEIHSPPPVPSSSPPCDDLSDDALSKYILDKLDKSDMSQDNSILKMLTCENQKMNTVKRKTTSLMIYGSRTSIHDTLSRGEKIRNSRASLNDRSKMNESSSNLLSSTLLDYNHSSSIETDSLRSYSADRGSSRLSLESDVSSKFDIAPSNMSSEVTSLNDSEMCIDFRNPAGYRNIEMMIKRRPLSDDSLFELVKAEIPMPSNDVPTFIDLDRYLDNLQPSTSETHHHHLNTSAPESNYKDNVIQAALQTVSHTRCSSTPVNHNGRLNSFGGRNSVGSQFRNISEQTANFMGSQSSCSSSGIPKSPMSYYSKNYDEEKILSKNLNNDAFSDKVKEFETEKIVLRTGNETNASSTSTGFHSRESSTEHSAPYYYSDLSSQEHINVLPTSHYLKNTNLHRKLNNQRRRGPLHKKNDISHIHNPIRNNQVIMSEPSFELAASARSVSVEFLSAADKDPEIDMKNIYESTGGRNSKIPESMNLSGLGCKRNSGSNNNSHNENSSLDSNIINASALIKLSSTSMSSHCSGNSSNTVYYDAEADAGAYENVICQGDKHWDEDSLWRDNLRRVSHRHARSMDDLDSMPAGTSLSSKMSMEACGMNSIKRVKKDANNKISRNVTYVNCDIQGRVLRNRENNTSFHCHLLEEEQKIDDNDVYVSLAENAEMSFENTDEGVYEQLAIDSLKNAALLTNTSNTINVEERSKKKFEIDREKLRQWDLMSSGLMKGRAGRVRGAGTSAGVGDAACSTDTGTDSASNEGIL